MVYPIYHNRYIPFGKHIKTDGTSPAGMSYRFGRSERYACVYMYAYVYIYTYTHTYLWYNLVHCNVSGCKITWFEVFCCLKHPKCLLRQKHVIELCCFKICQRFHIIIPKIIQGYSGFNGCFCNETTPIIILWRFLDGFPPQLPRSRLPGNLPVSRSFASVVAWSAGINPGRGSWSNWGYPSKWPVLSLSNWRFSNLS